MMIIPNIWKNILPFIVGIYPLKNGGEITWRNSPLVTHLHQWAVVTRLATDLSTSETEEKNLGYLLVSSAIPKMAMENPLSMEVLMVYKWDTGYVTTFFLYHLIRLAGLPDRCYTTQCHGGIHQKFGSTSQLAELQYNMVGWKIPSFLWNKMA